MEKKLKNAIIMNRLTKIMFVLGFLLTSMWSYSSNSVYAQNQKFSFEFKQTSIKTIFQYIEKHSEFIFMYRTDLLDTSKKVSVKVEKQSIEQILEQVLKGTSVVYEINDRQIVLKKGLERSEEVPQQSRQKKLIQGLVKDDKGDVIIGATIKVKGTTIGTTTNMDGLYNLSVPSENSILIVSYIGYATQEIKVGNRQNIIITLQEDAKNLEEVVVTAYGTGQKKASMVGSVQSIRPADLKVPASNLSTSFAGRLAGVIAVQRSGEPGADGANFWIRGVSTLGSASTSPLIIIDGIESTTTDLNALDPEVIDGFSILKDATATAMYGMRGANGVMIVTTKSGAALDKPIINFRMEASMSTPTSIPEFVDGVTFMELYNEAVRNQPAGKEAYTQERIDGTRQGLNPYIFPDVDWYGEMFKDRSFSETFNFNIQIIIKSQKQDLSNHIIKIINSQKKESQIIKNISNKYLENIEKIKLISKSDSKQFFIIINQPQENNKEEICIDQLNEKYLKIKEGLLRCGNIVTNVNNEKETKEIIRNYIFLNDDENRM